ncbi:Uroporphyrinogen decarboxylase in heme biosynthesis [Blastocladiella emersonii ATCC 22665]|nr:Uroporphyrinogen decarboxylase in heme biosynthesis [Blastocladiella emersonii ATCC 22665]
MPSLVSEIAAAIVALEATKEASRLAAAVSAAADRDLVDLAALTASSLFERAVLVRPTPDVAHLVCWPKSPLASAVRISWSKVEVAAAAAPAEASPSASPKQQSRNRRGSGRKNSGASPKPASPVAASSVPTAALRVEAELLPYFINEDDALDWHTAARDVAIAHSADYAAVKRAADEAFRAADGKAYRGIGGLRADLPLAGTDSAGLAHAVVIPLFTAYIATVARHAAAVQAVELGEADYVSPPATFDLPPPPAPLTPEEDAWVAARRGELALALFAAGLPAACLPPNAAFPTATVAAQGTDFVAAAPRRARSMATATIAPRHTYIETLFVQALRGVSVPRPPVWLHRQAGRYLPEYRQVKGDKNFLEMTADPAIATEITLQPVWRYNVDCAIIFSDIMTIPQALGMELIMQPGPFFPHPIRTLEDIERLAYQPAILQHVYDALTLTRAQLPRDKALVGFCGAPWTLMAYMIGKDLAKKWLHMHPEWAHLLLRKCTDVAIDYLCKQVDAGADIVQVFESNAVDLGPTDFYEFALPYLADIARRVKAVHPHIPMTVFPRGANFATARIVKETLYDAISIDWAGIPAEQRAAAGPYMTLQGNLEPDVMYEPLDNIRTKVRAMIREFGKHRYIVNLGHGTKLDMSTESVGAFVEEAQTIVLGSRNSPLAMAQAEIVHKALVAHQAAAAERTPAPSATSGWNPQPAHRFRIDGVMTKGDKILDVALAKIGDKGLFTKELEVALQSGAVALVQHSLKDLETTQPPALALGAVLAREDKRDALVSRAGHAYTIESLPSGATVGTSSLRRRAQLAAARPDLRIIDVRGNLNTRIAKLLGTHAATADVHYDAIVLAVAGLARLPNATEALAGVHVQPIDPAVMVPAVSQGAIGVQIRARDAGMHRLVKAIEDAETRLTCDHERDFLRAIQGGCQVPVAVNTVRRDDGKIEVEAHVWSVDGKQHLATTATSGLEAAQKLVKAGAQALVDAARF